MRRNQWKSALVEMCLIAWIVLPSLLPCPAVAAETPAADAVRAAITKSVPLLELGAKGSLEKRPQCFTCHNQGLPIQALTVARARGIEIDDDNLKTQVQFTADFLARNKANYLTGKGPGGQVDTAGYALWALDNGGWPADETTAAVTEYLLRFQNDHEHWQPQSRRPPTEQSWFTSSFLALRGLQTWGTPEQRDRIQARTERVRKWLLETTPQDTEDRVFRLRALQLINVPEADRQRASEELLQMQREDGGWSQLTELPSDAYATGSALAALHAAGGLRVDTAPYRAGLNYLLTIQKPDGSWHVVSRSKPIQSYFESGYPHGKDQFISIAAASWATMALALSLPQEPAK